MRLKFPFCAALIISLALPAFAQKKTSQPVVVDDSSYKGKYKNPGQPPASPYDLDRDEASGRIEWMKERLNGKPGPGFSQLMVAEAARQRKLYPSQTAG